MSHKTFAYDTLKAMLGLRVLLPHHSPELGLPKVIDFKWPDCTLVLIEPSGKITHGIPADVAFIHEDDQDILVKRLAKRHGMSLTEKSESS